MEYEKKIYAVKRGRKTGIFNEWLKCFEQTGKYQNSKFRSFEYRSELETEDVPGSLRYAIKEAEEYLGDLAYLGESRRYEKMCPYHPWPGTERQCQGGGRRTE